jgi:hypothetical protein
MMMSWIANSLITESEQSNWKTFMTQFRMMALLDLLLMAFQFLQKGQIMSRTTISYLKAIGHLKLIVF